MSEVATVAEAIRLFSFLPVEHPGTPCDITGPERLAGPVCEIKVVEIDGAAGGDFDVSDVAIVVPALVLPPTSTHFLKRFHFWYSFAKRSSNSFFSASRAV